MAASAAMNLQLKKFSMINTPEDAVCIFIGRRRTGKSTLVRDLLFHHKTLPLGTVISGTEESNDFYKKIVPPLFIHGAYSPVIIQNYVNRQKLIMQKIMKEQAERGQSRIDPRSFLILDDCLYDDTWIRDLNIRYLFLNGRWVKVFFLITMQYPLGVPPILRTNVDYVFILREPYMSNRRRIFENYGSAFPSFEFFCQVMDQCTQNYECLVISNNTQSNKIEDIIFWYKAELHGDFRIGAPEFWSHSAQHYRDQEESEINKYDASNAIKLKGPQIQVRKGN
jgi:hypothetical protein|uniref:ATPase domain containing protein n=1 Tax=viral metagenome TaxID=1070528 RepID=A0A6C0LR91_9ZZZZ